MQQIVIIIIIKNKKKKTIETKLIAVKLANETHI